MPNSRVAARRQRRGNDDDGDDDGDGERELWIFRRYIARFSPQSYKNRQPRLLLGRKFPARSAVSVARITPFLLVATCFALFIFLALLPRTSARWTMETKLAVSRREHRREHRRKKRWAMVLGGGGREGSSSPKTALGLKPRGSEVIVTTPPVR